MIQPARNIATTMLRFVSFVVAMTTARCRKNDVVVSFIFNVSLRSIVTLPSIGDRELRIVVNALRHAGTTAFVNNDVID